MRRFADIVKQDTPRLVVEGTWDVNGSEEQYRWGIVGKMSILPLISCLISIQSGLSSTFGGEIDRFGSCDQRALVVVWTGKRFEVFLHPDIPTASLVGMLEVIKIRLIMSTLPQPRSNLLGPDGAPFLNGRQ